MSEREPQEWPDASAVWWWMRFRPTKRSKWRVWIVQLETNEGIEYIAPHNDSHCYPRSFCVKWESTFLPVVDPPLDWLAGDPSRS